MFYAPFYQSSIAFTFRMIRKAPGLKLVVQTLLYSLKPIGNTILIAGIFFLVFGILGVQVRTVQVQSTETKKKYVLINVFNGSNLRKLIFFWHFGKN